MARATSTAVRKILRDGTAGGDYDNINCPDLSPFINWAELIVDDVYACSVAKGSPYSTAKLRSMAEWLSAHAYGVSDRVYKSKTTLRASATFAGDMGKYLEFTSYGQNAKLLDNLGCLEALGKTKTVSGYWLGRPPSEQTDYVDRD